MLDTIRVTASTIFTPSEEKDPKKLNSFEFRIKLADGLVMSFLISRAVKGLTKAIL